MATTKSINFGMQMSQFAIKTDKQLHKAVRRGALGLFSAIMKGTPVDKGSARMSWFISFNSFSNEVKELTEKMSEQAINQIKQDEFEADLLRYKAGDLVTITNNSDHIETLEYGLFPWKNSAKVVNGFSIQASQGFVRLNLMKWDTFVSAPLKKGL